MASAPGRQVCQMCSLDEFLDWTVEGPGLFRYTCTSPSHDAPHSWLTTGRDPLKMSAHEGLARELGLYDDLLALFDPAGPWLEYGIVEYRYGKANPVHYKQIIDIHSHTALGPTTASSASAFISSALGHLRDEGLLASRLVKATGFWKYNGTLLAWTRPPVPDDRPLETWQSFADSIGVPTDTWPLDTTTRTLV